MYEGFKFEIQIHIPRECDLFFFFFPFNWKLRFVCHERDKFSDCKRSLHSSVSRLEKATTDERAT